MRAYVNGTARIEQSLRLAEAARKVAAQCDCTYPEALAMIGARAVIF